MKKGNYAFQYDDEVWGDFVTPAESDRLALLSCREGEERFPDVEFVPTRGEIYPPSVVQSDDSEWAIQRTAEITQWVYGECDPWYHPDMIWDIREIIEVEGTDYYARYGNNAVYPINSTDTAASVTNSSMLTSQPLSLAEGTRVIRTGVPMWSSEDSERLYTQVSELCPF